MPILKEQFPDREISFNEYNSLQLADVRYATGDNFSVGNKEQKQFGTVFSIIVYDKAVYLIGKLYNSDYNNLDKETEMYIVTETDTLALFDATRAKREQFVCVDDNTMIVNFFAR